MAAGSNSQFVDDMKKELRELAKLGVMNQAQLARALEYVEQNRAEYSDPDMYNDVSGAVDCVVEIVGCRGCG